MSSLNSSPNLSPYLILIHQPAGGVPPPEELQKIMVRFNAWMDGMKAKGILQGTAGLELTGKVLRGRRGAVAVDGPYAEAKEIVGGYVLISATSLEEAVEVARDCPGLDYPMAIEVRPVRTQRYAQGSDRQSPDGPEAP